MKNFFQPGCTCCQRCEDIKLCLNLDTNVAQTFVENTNSPTFRLTVEGVTDNTCNLCDEKLNQTWDFPRIWFGGGGTYNSGYKSGRQFCIYSMGYYNALVAKTFEETLCQFGFYFNGKAWPWIYIGINYWHEFNSVGGNTNRDSILMCGFRGEFTLAKTLPLTTDVYTKICDGTPIEVTNIPAFGNVNWCNISEATFTVQTIWP